ncbi:MAG: hypothetical protein ACTS1Z_08765 [Parasphingopyxis sp.]|uniref:hypothetical protein n=1 Tax=Parasphingopyxis sp. TaxID=1920299 RepID=UPI003F9F76B7
MAIEFVDPAALDESRDSQPIRRPLAKLEKPREADHRPGRLVDIEVRLSEAVGEIDAQLETLRELNARLFGDGKTKAQGQRNGTSSRSEGIVATLDIRVADIEDRLAQLKEQIRAITTLV